VYDDIRSNLWNEGFTDEEVSYDVALLEQYKLYVELADRVSQRRGTANTFFLSINSLVAVVVGGFWANQATWWSGLIGPPAPRREECRQVPTRGIGWDRFFAVVV